MAITRNSNVTPSPTTSKVDEAKFQTRELQSLFSTYAGGRIEKIKPCQKPEQIQNFIEKKCAQVDFDEDDEFVSEYCTTSAHSLLSCFNAAKNTEHEDTEIEDICDNASYQICMDKNKNIHNKK